HLPQPDALGDSVPDGSSEPMDYTINVQRRGTSSLRAEVEYVRDHLAAHGILTTEWTLHDPPKPPAIAANRSPSPVIVATPNGLEVGESLLQDATLVYFTRPQSDADRAWLLSALHTGVARAAILPVDEPPVTAGS
ncbi:hypothetical protein, partial [Micromonospora sp. NPDC007230]|uniref:hypothetical protein n=1 Tax=Micromonospora sp. NPDC007230 TaxID=3364237 RepID=UPI0036CF88BA